MGGLRGGVLVLIMVLALTTVARADFPYRPQGDPTDYRQYRLPSSDPVPDDLTGKLTWMYAATAEADSPFASDARELDGVRGAHLLDAERSAAQGWETTTGRPDVTIGVTDSGIEWDNAGAVEQIRRKTRISRGEVDPPQVNRATSTEAGEDCADYHEGGFDVNGDGVFNVVDYSCDTAVDPGPAKGVGPPALLDPQDVLIAFSDDFDDDGNGYVDDMVGWDFLDDDNDPFDDVSYGHGTGEAQDSSAEADNGGSLGTCPNCMVVHLRVGTSFVADVNRFAEAVVYATDNDVLVVQDALGTLNKSDFTLKAIKYAYDHGTTVIASAADEAAQHHNQPSSLPYSIVVNSVTHDDTVPGEPSPESYLQFNGCTNFSSRITLAIPSVSCSSDATGRGAGMAGLVYAAALNADTPHPLNGCVRVGGDPCPITPNEVRQILVEGSDDVNFAQTPTGTSLELSCRPLALPACTDPFLAAPTTRVATPPRSYPARKGHDQFYGYGRVNMARSLAAVADGQVPPEVEVTSPDWFDMVDPEASDVQVDGILDNRGEPYTCTVYAAPGSYPGDGDFTELTGVSDVCDGSTALTERVTGAIAAIPMATLQGLFPAGATFDGNAGAQQYGGRPNTEPHGFVVKVVATAAGLRGQDRRQAYLHRDQDMLDGFPKQLPGDVEASPVLADLDGDNENELVIANSDGVIHAYERDGGEVAGWPQTTGAVRPDHAGAPGHAIGWGHEAVLATPAVADLDRDGVPEVVVADLDRRVRVFAADGTLAHVMETDPRYAGIPGAPFVNLRHGNRNRTQPGAIAAPVLADLDTDGTLEIVLASMDRHVYAWHADGTAVDGFPVLTVDRAKLSAIDPDSHQVTFSGSQDVGDGEQQGAIVDTPAVGDITGDARPEIVVGTNEEYPEDLNAGGLDEAIYAPLGAALSPGNGRLFAIEPTGVPGADATKLDNDVYVDGWPFAVGILQRGLLPLVGEGVTGSPVIGEVPCQASAASVRIGTIPAAGLPYVLNPDGTSCFGQTDGKDIALPTSGGPGADPVFFAAVGHPAFGTLAGKPSFLAPAAGLTRALDVVLPEYQGGSDYLAAWDLTTRQIAPGWPATVNDLQFLTGPALADVGGAPGSEVFAGTASDDLQGLTGAATPIDDRWPKLTGDWTVTIPAIGTWGGGDTKVLVSGTRSGRLLAYDTGGDPCAEAEWPQFHHDPANSGDARRDAIPPGRPTGAAIAAGEITFTAPGDDLTCGTPAGYELATSDDPTPTGFAAAGSDATIPLPGDAKRYVAVRAVDEQGNVGRAAVVDRGGAPAPSPSAGPSPGPSASPSPGAAVTPSPTTTPALSTACSVRRRGTIAADVLRGTGRSERLIGRRGDDRLYGGRGRDCLLGGRGDDRLYGGGGRDRLAGGPGRDRLVARGSAADVVDCGAGRHDVAVVDPRDTVRRCETVRRR